MDKFGCGLVVFLIVLAFLIFDNPIYWAIAIGLVLLMFIFFVIKGMHDTRPSKASQKMDRDFFQQISKATEDLYSEFQSACASPEFVRQIDESGFDLNINGKPLQNSDEKVQLLFWVDVVRCYRGLGLPYTAVDKTSYGLYYFVERTIGMKKITYNTYKFLYRPTQHVNSETIIANIANYVDGLSDNGSDFLVAYIYGKIDDSRRQRYIVKLYRFASIIAKADNTVTKREADWLSSIMQLQSSGDNTTITGDDETPHATSINLEKEPGSGAHGSPYKELQNLIGLSSVKKEVETLADYVRIQKARQRKGMKVTPVSYHCVFTGNPGTGKTTVARILARIYKDLGVVSEGHLVETDRSGLIAEYVGQTAVKTNKVIDKALGGVLFIDEAYSLLGGGQEDYGKEAVATLLKRMEDDRDRLVVVLAGYTREMKEFIDSNPGLQSRFSRYIEFPDYNADELYQIFQKQLERFEYTISPEAAAAVKDRFTYQVAHKDANFGNARFARNFFERTLQRQATRLAKEVNLTTDKLAGITKEDLPEEF